jgi:carbon monoxide dehydrogenase subunit G
MEQEHRTRKRGWVPLLIGAAGLATGLVIGGARAVKEVEVSSEWEIDAPAEQVFEMLLDTRNYAEWWPEVAGRTNTSDPFITLGTVAQCALRLPLSLLPFRPVLHVTIRFPQIERNQRIRARLTGDVTGIAEWVLVPQGQGVILKNNTRLRLRHPLMNLAALALPESTWRANLESMLLEVQAGLRQELEFAGSALAVYRR